MAAQVENVVELDTKVPSDMAKIMRRKVYDALDAAYDEKQKRYRTKLTGEHTDQSIADSIGCTVALVEKIREEFFGPPGRAEPTAQIKAMHTKLGHLERESDEMDKLASGLTKQTKEHRQKIGVLKDDLKRFIESHGWGA